MSLAIIVFGHGSRIESANESVRQAARELALAGGIEHVEPAFLELGEPSLEGAVTRLMARGVYQIRVIPYFLTLGLHMERDLPRLVERISKTHQGLLVEVAPPMDGHPALVTVLADRYRALRNT